MQNDIGKVIDYFARRGRITILQTGEQEWVCKFTSKLKDIEIETEPVGTLALSLSRCRHIFHDALRRVNRREDQ